MRKYFTATEKRNGEMAVRLLSINAQSFYNDTDPISVMECVDEEGNKSYSIRGFDDRDDMSFDEMEEYFEECFFEYKWNSYHDDCREIARQCSEEGYPSWGGNYELRVEQLQKSYPELFGDNDDGDEDYDDYDDDEDYDYDDYDYDEEEDIK